jgi:hypothetical protein
VTLKDDEGHKVRMLVARAVCLAFHGEPPREGLEVRHLNGRHMVDRPDNLAWGTRKDQHADDRQNGVVRSLRCAVVSIMVEVEDRRLLIGVSSARLAELSGMSEPTFSRYRSGKRSPSAAVLTTMRRVLDKELERRIEALAEFSKEGWATPERPETE